MLRLEAPQEPGLAGRPAAGAHLSTRPLLQLRLSPEQIEQKKVHQAAIKAAADELAAAEEEGGEKKPELEAALAARQEELEGLMERFAVRGGEARGDGGCGAGCSA